ncbi:ATP-dependent RNA helicase SUPV3L1/SUV3 [Rhodoblastus acidophilus]|uniref:ATP-dependent RNA helicase SUPV3L1/SUV3 n=1 Tax=Rhodoblastus acidophilus TaxID=1074 RepID=A0A212RL66_RHOAC|nr:helicase-related protein [Rhodoblastus acidophilus]PPQ39049.1 helicase [Rhodoblastus acidophilus]RAI17020.1 helicase [Rhodoblastus acidophilus]SNB73072.1 ATP-dependent RNA helicase SUPV3L1/SUV3 [Rhodoblastus acidophilus]
MVNRLSENVSAILGPTNTGKTHFAIERMLSHKAGMIGLPLRLLAREVYNRVVAKAGPEAVALITGEEKIKPRGARYWVSTVEAMPRDLSLPFVAIDEIQLAASFDRGHVFTDRLLHRRGSEETLLIGAGTMQEVLEKLLPGVRIQSRPRFSQLLFAGDRKIARLPRRSAIVTFRAEDVYAIAEWLRRMKGGAAVVLGALSPRTRNAQIELYQNGEVDYIVATDAIGMGLNLDVDHVAFASDRKFDGYQFRRLTPAEFGQIAGRAGRHTRDGSFGSTGRCPPLDEELAGMIEAHAFDPVTLLQWRNAALDFSSLESLVASLDQTPDHPGLTRAPMAEDQIALEAAMRDATVRRHAKTRADIERLWEVCQIPDYRKTSPAAHADLCLSVFAYVVRAGRIPDDWIARQISSADRVDGDIDALSARISIVRTCAFIANRNDWLNDPEHWQGVARQVEDNLSDALHARLTQRFVDRRASVLMRRLRENTMMEAEITATGQVMVEGHHVGSLLGFCFTPDPAAGGEQAKTLTAAAQKALAAEIEARARRVHEAVDDAFVLANDGLIRWLGEPVGRIGGGDHLLKPRVKLIADELLSGAQLEQVQARLDLWLAQHVKKLLGPLEDLEIGDGLEGVARGIAFQIGEALGVLERSRVAEEMKTISQEARAALRKFGVRFGAYHLYLPALLKPAPRALAAQLWALQHGGLETVRGIDEVAHLAASGRTSFAADAQINRGLYRAAGFRVCGERAVRVDILERLADLIRPAIAYRPGVTPGDAPAGAADGDGFVVTVAMTSLAGCSGEAFSGILKSLGYASEQRPGPAITVPLLPKASTEPVKVSAPETETQAVTAEAGATETEATEDAQGAEPASAPEVAAESEIPAETASTETEAAPEAPAPEAEGEPAATTETAAPETAAESETPADEAAAEPETPAEPTLTEVWRPHRPHHHGRRPAGGEQRRHGGPRRGPGGPRPESAGGEAPAEGGAPRRDRPEGGKPRFEGKRRFEGKFDGKRRDESKPGDRPHQAEKRPPREKKADPDSPFAKLAALKAELEAKGNK